MPNPTIIQGPAFVLQNSYAFYTKGNVTIEYDYQTWNPTVAIGGKLGPRLATKAARIKMTPAGMYTSGTAAKYWPFNPSGIGATIMAGTVAVVPMTGNKITFARGGISKMPGLKLSSLETVWKEMEFLCIGDNTTTPTNAAYFQTIAATTADTSFDETKIISPRYTAAFTGADGAAQSGVEPDENGFDVEPAMEVKMMQAANYGFMDAILVSLGLTVTFAPLSLSEAQIALSAGLQNATALQPGDTIGTATDLVIAGTGLSFTGKKMGISQANLVYGSGEWRQGGMRFENKLYSTTGALQPLWVFA